MTSKKLCQLLTELPDQPWSEIQRGMALSTNGLARRLKPFSIRPAQQRIGQSSAKGYALEDFREAFERYLPATDPVSQIPTETSKQTSENKNLGDISTETSGPNVSVGSPANPPESQTCFDVSVGKGEDGDDAMEEVIL